MDERSSAEVAERVRRVVDDLDVGKPAIESILLRGRSRRRASRIRVAAIGSLCVMALVASLYGLSGLWEGPVSAPTPAQVPTPTPTPTLVAPGDTGGDPESVAHSAMAALIVRATPPYGITRHMASGRDPAFPFRLRTGTHVTGMLGFWLADTSSTGQTIAWLLAHGPQGLRVVGHGSNATGRTTYLEYDAPSTWAYRAASLSIDVEPTDHKSTVVWAYAHARWIPLPRVSERVPKSVMSVWVLAYRGSPSNVLASEQRMDERAARALESYLNRLPVDNRVSPGCRGDTELRIRIRFGAESGAPEFTAWPDCAEIVVTKNGEAQPILTMKGHLPALLTHLGLSTSSSGTRP